MQFYSESDSSTVEFTPRCHLQQEKNPLLTFFFFGGGGAEPKQTITCQVYFYGWTCGSSRALRTQEGAPLGSAKINRNKKTTTTA